MTRYEFQKFSKTGTDAPFETNGEIVQTYGQRPYSANFVALVRLPDRGSGPVTFAEDSEGVDVPYCTGATSDGGRCTREVDETGDTCWQH